jgi:uncharacterized membrane protein YtjA (UPF0391 family)
VADDVPEHDHTERNSQQPSRDIAHKRLLFAIPAIRDPSGTAYALTRTVRVADGGGEMIYYALVFLVLALIAGALGVSGVAAVSSQIAWVLFVVGLILMVVHFVTGRRTAV